MALTGAGWNFRQVDNLIPRAISIEIQQERLLLRLVFVRAVYTRTHTIYPNIQLYGYHSPRRLEECGMGLNGNLYNLHSM